MLLLLLPLLLLLLLLSLLPFKVFQRRLLLRFCTLFPSHLLSCHICFFCDVVSVPFPVLVCFVLFNYIYRSESPFTLLDNLIQISFSTMRSSVVELRSSADECAVPPMNGPAEHLQSPRRLWKVPPPRPPPLPLRTLHHDTCLRTR